MILLLTSCSETSLSKVDEGSEDAIGDLSVTPTWMEFGVLAPGERVVQTVALTSVGTAPVTVTNIWSEGSTAFTITVPDGALTLDPGDSAQLAVTYSPISVDDLGTLHVDSDGLHPTAEVRLIGSGAWPAIAVDPPRLDLVSTDGEAVSGELTITSVGEVPLTVDTTLLFGDEFTATDPAPVTLDPGESAAITVTYTPTAYPQYTAGEVWVSSDAPTGDVLVPITGTAPTDCIGLGEAWDRGELSISMSRAGSSLVAEALGERPACVDDWYVVVSEESQDAAMGDPAVADVGPYPMGTLELLPDDRTYFYADHTTLPAWYCVERQQYTAGGAVYDFLGAHVPPPMLDLMLAGDQDGSWDYQDDNPAVVVGRTTNWFSLEWSGTSLPVGLFVMNMGSQPAVVEAWETIPAGWSASGFSPAPADSRVNSDGSTTYGFVFTLEARDQSTGGQTVYDREDVTYTLDVGACATQEVLPEAEAWWADSSGARVVSTANPMVIDCR